MGIKRERERRKKKNLAIKRKKQDLCASLVLRHEGSLEQKNKN